MKRMNECKECKERMDVKNEKNIQNFFFWSQGLRKSKTSIRLIYQKDKNGVVMVWYLSLQKHQVTIYSRRSDFAIADWFIVKKH